MTGRSTVAETAAEVGARGGRGIPVRTDHTDDRPVDVDGRSFEPFRMPEENRLPDRRTSPDG